MEMGPHKVRRELAVGTEDVKVKAMNMSKYKEGLRFCKLSLCSTYTKLSESANFNIILIKFKPPNRDSSNAEIGNTTGELFLLFLLL